MITGAKEQILSALIDEHGQEIDSDAIVKAADELLCDIDDIRPQIKQDVISAFIEKVNGPKVGATITRVQSINDIPSEISAFLQREKLPAKVMLQEIELLTQLDWQSAGIQISATDSDIIAVGKAKYGIAETGSIVIHSDADTAILFSFVPEVYIVVVNADDLLMYLEDYADTGLSNGTPFPRNACLITGASGTTDIEGELVLGAHGPGKVHVIVINTSC